MRARQIDFFENSKDHAPRRTSHGGAQVKGKRKLSRPLDPKRPIHLVLKSSVARGHLSLLGPRHRLSVERILRRWAVRFTVKIHFFENMGNHLHIVVSFPKRANFQKFLKTATAQIARTVTGALKGRPFGQRFWDTLPFTRVITGRRDFLGLKNYFFKNKIERDLGVLSRKTVEEFAQAERTARRRGVDVWEVLQSPGSANARQKRPPAPL